MELTGAVQLNVGSNHACVVTTSGGAKCWGDDTYGQLGDGRQNHSRTTAGDVVGLTSGVAMVSTGSSHSCALMVSGGVKCWGWNGSGQLGDGTTVQRLTPVDVVGLSSPAIFIAVAGSNTCAVLNTGALQCWGDNSFGQLGNGSTVGSTTPTGVTGLASGVVQVAVAFEHMCAVVSDGSARCWGKNTTGQLGDGTTTDRLVPGNVLSLSAGVVSVAAAAAQGSSSLGQQSPPIGHSCAVMAGGGTRCWGNNANGEVGDGTRTNRLTPVEAVGLASGTAQVSLGGRADYFGDGIAIPFLWSCAATTGGAAKCWGCGVAGQDSSLSCGSASRTSRLYLTPTTVPGLASGVVAVSAGSEFNCALTVDGKVKCWSGGSAPEPVMGGTLSQSLVFGSPPNVSIGGSGTLLSSGGPSGVPLTFTSLTPSACTLRALPPDQSGTTVDGLASGLCTVAANQGGSVYYDPAPQRTITFRIGPPVGQTITLGAAPTVTVSGVGNLSATASSGLSVSFSSNTPSICAVSGTTVSGLAAGSCTVTAQQAGDALYTPAPQQTQTFSVTVYNGTYGLTVTKSGTGGGAVTSSPAGVNCGPSCGANFSAGSSVTLNAIGDSNSVFSGWSGACSGTGSCTVVVDSPKSVIASFGPNTVVPRLTNISTRMQVLTGDNVMIGGFIIGGSITKTVVVRARGPSLASQGVTGTLANPKLDLYSGQTLIASNDDWQTASNAGQLGGSGYAPDMVSEAAILIALAPGAYTAIVGGVNGTTGTGIVEVFEVDHAESPLINIATRGLVQTGNDVMIGGFAITGASSRTVVVRARGPSLAAFGIANPLQDPVIELYSGANLIATNDNWADDSRTAGQISSSGFSPSNALESAIMRTLNPGLYTVIVRGANGGTGVGLVEVFAVQ